MPLVEVAGSIGSGKTTFVDALSNHLLTGVYEDHTINPFWKAFYTDPLSCAFETEVSFLLQHYHFAKLAGRRTNGAVLLDHSFELDMAYAEVGLEGSRKEIFTAIYREIRSEIGMPHVLVFITCSPDEMLRRVRDRGRSFEDNISLDFLAELQRALERRIAAIADSVSVVAIDAETTDFRNPGLWRENLIERLHHQCGILV